MTEAKKRRRGGSSRAARRAERMAATPADALAVQPGQESNRYRPLSDSDMQRVHEAVLETLETIGLCQAIPTCVEKVVAAGGTYTDEGRLLFPRELVLDILENVAAKEVTLYAQDPKHDIHLAGNKVHFATAGAAVSIVDPKERTYRDSQLADVYDIARMVDHLDHIHFHQRSVVARDLTNPYEMDLNTCYAAVSGTKKHVGSSWVEPEHFTKTMEMLHMIAGGEEAWRERPFVSMSNCFVVPPLRFAEESCECLELAVYAGMPVLLLSAGQAGATAPTALAGTVVQEVAEVLAGIVYVNLLVPGAPAVFGTWPFVADLRTGSMTGGSGEQALVAAACAQMGSFYGLPTGVAAGMSDSKVPDAQSGYEKGYNIALAANSGANIIYESCGMQGSLMGACYESFVIDNDMLGAINRTVRGIEITDETLSVSTMHDACVTGPMHYLNSPQTYSMMQTEYLYPELGDRDSPADWTDKGQLDAADRAAITAKEILSTHYPNHISDEIDAAIREKFPIRLPRAAMGK